MFDKASSVVHVASYSGNYVRKRWILRIFICLLIFGGFVTLVFRNRPEGLWIPTTPDLCELWKGETPRTPATLWWQWACLIEWDMDSGNGYQCQNMEYMGNWPVCWDEPYRPKGNCLVYSFGINYDFSFDEAMAKRGCTVYSFDPSMGMVDHKHSDGVIFMNMGLGAADDDSFHPNFDLYVSHSTKWKMRTLKSIMAMLGHEKRVIDVLKIDIEVYEWAVTANIMKDQLFPQIRQFLVEWHVFPNVPSRENFKDIYDAYMSLKEAGLRSYLKSSCCRYHHYKYFNSQADMAYVNTKLTPPLEQVGI
ncbi:uncharacterized protein [Haliotis cracherodii]|uniref:uncharacterized protein n=1 Tax=Haliotis cracherodii TaxID=6455 RepID=UPI0039ED0654